MTHLTQTPRPFQKRAERARLALTHACLLASLLAPATTAAQGTTTYGALFGQVESRQLHSHDTDSETRTDVVFGVFVDAATPLSWLHIVLEASYARRGGDYETETDDGSVTQSARVDYLSFALFPTGRVGLGRAALYASLGFARESDMNVRSTAELAPLFTDPASQVFALVALAGVEVSIARGWSARLEVRENNQVSTAFTATSGDIRHRSREIVLKIGMRPGG